MVTGGGQRWQLSGYNKAGELIHDETIVGDPALDDALRLLECRPDCTKTAVRIETLGNRQTLRAPRPQAAELVIEPDKATCHECDLPERDCRRRAAVNGHEFTPHPWDIAPQSPTPQGETA